MKSLIYSVVFLLSLSSCNVGQKQSNNDLNIGNLIIPDSLYSFFPDYTHDYAKCKNTVIVTNAGKTDLPYYMEEFAITFLVSVYNCQNRTTFDSIMNNVLEKSIKQYKSENDNYFIIDSERDLLSRYDTLTLKNLYITHLPNSLVICFSSVFGEEHIYSSTLTTSGLSEGYEILILKSGNDYILPEKYKYEWEILPDKLKHGYVGGAAFKETELNILYWIVAW